MKERWEVCRSGQKKSSHDVRPTKSWSALGNSGLQISCQRVSLVGSNSPGLISLTHSATEWGKLGKGVLLGEALSAVGSDLGGAETYSLSLTTPLAAEQQVLLEVGSGWCSYVSSISSG